MDFLGVFLDYLNQQFALASQSSWQTLWVFVLNGGWIVLVAFFLRVTFLLFVDRMQGIGAGHIKFTLLAITIPKMNEQTPRAVENFFNQISGAHTSGDLIEAYWEGHVQPWFSFEVISIEGYLQFLIYTPVKFRDLVEASLYAQYPDCEILEVEDYTKFAPKQYPDPEYDIWGTEVGLVKDEVYPLQTYRDFEHPVTKQFFKDPMAGLLEAMSRLGRGEQFWFQIYVQPTDKSWQKRGFKEAGSLTQKFVAERATPTHPFPVLHRGEMKIVEDVHNKAAKNGFKCKIRILYIAKKEVYNPKRIQYAVVGALKQFARDDANGLKPNIGLTGVSGHYMFKTWQKNMRKREVITAYKNRSGSRGGNKYVLNVEELATIWHFPMAHAVRVPSLASVEAKRGEAPSRLPLEVEFENPMQRMQPKKEEPAGDGHGHGGGHGGGHDHIVPPAPTDVLVEPPHPPGLAHDAAPPPNLPVA